MGNTTCHSLRRTVHRFIKYIAVLILAAGFLLATIIRTAAGPLNTDLRLATVSAMQPLGATLPLPRERLVQQRHVPMLKPAVSPSTTLPLPEAPQAMVEARTFPGPSAQPVPAAPTLFGSPPRPPPLS
jgi:hypothetical protein